MVGEGCALGHHLPLKNRLVVCRAKMEILIVGEDEDDVGFTCLCCERQAGNGQAEKGTDYWGHVSFGSLNVEMSKKSRREMRSRGSLQVFCLIRQEVDNHGGNLMLFYKSL